MSRFRARAVAFLAGMTIAAGMGAAHTLHADPAQPAAPAADIAAGLSKHTSDQPRTKEPS
ncbi:MAG TPA: hypothetical protein VM689_04975 [Aliidongia sp.]|nr:hypothetical protein [Aliidongia sp.]